MTRHERRIEPPGAAGQEQNAAMTQRMILPLVSLALGILLSGCRPEVPPVVNMDFNTSTTVLRGQFTGTLPGTTPQALNLNVTAAYSTESEYVISGNGTLGGDAFTISGTGGGGVHYLKSQTSPIPPGAHLTLKFAAQADIRLDCVTYNSVDWMCWNSAATNAIFPLTRQN